MIQTYAVLLAANFILVLFLLKILHHAFVDPTHKISNFIKNVIANIDSPPRIRSQRNDELGQLTQNLNEMIVQFCNHKAKSINKAYRAGSDRVRAEIIEELRLSTSQIIPLVSNLETRLWSLSLNSLEKLHAEVQCSKPGEFDWKYLEDMLEMNGDYLKHELNDQRKQVRKIKQALLRIATTLKGLSVKIDHSKPFTSSSKSDKF